MPRLSVVVSQASKADGKSAEREEQIVAQLMMTAGVDLVLVGPMERIEPQSTDHLCLSSLSQDFVLITWLEHAALLLHWNRIGMVNSLGDCSFPARDAASAPARVYHLSMSAQASVEAVMSQIRRVQSDRDTKTFGISFGPGQTSQNAKVPPSSKAPQQISNDITKPAPRETANAAHEKTIEPFAEAADGELDSETWNGLEQLVDDLNNFEL